MYMYMYMYIIINKECGKKNNVELHVHDIMNSWVHVYVHVYNYMYKQGVW